jgi:predicted ATPase
MGARTNVSPALTRFVGRARELASLRELFDAGERLVTLVGGAGMGKTRLARRFAETAELELEQGGVWLCDLTEARDVDSICSVVAAVLEIPVADRDARVADKLGHALAARGPMLLVLDNFEQIVDCASATVGLWLARCPDARFLVTSRARLQVEGENVVPLGPLESPREGPSEGVTLLLDRVRRLRRDATFSPDDLARLETIVQQLDAIPLAIELAAPRIALLGTKTLLELLGERFAILTSPARTSGKGAALRDAFDWSWELLSSAEREALAQCSVFRGGFDLEAAREVVTLTGAPLVDVLQSLHDQSLLLAEDGRFNLFLSTREYAAEKLRLLGATDDAAARHARHYATVGRAHASAASGPGWREARAWLAREKENLKQAATRVGGDASDALAAAIALEPLMGTDGPFGEYLAILDRAILDRAIASADDHVAPALLVEARILRGTIRRQVGQIDGARADLEDARAHAPTPALKGRALAGLAMVDLARGELPASAERFEQAIEVLAQTDDRLHEAMARASFGAVLAGRGELDRARRCEEEALALHSRAGNLREAGMVTAFLGNLCIDAGAYDEARVHFAHAAAIHDEVKNRFGQAFTAGNLAILQHRTGSIADALASYDASLAGFREIGARRYVGAFEGYRALALEEAGRAEEARERLREACAVLAEAHDERFQALFEAHLARSTASIDLASAERQLAAASQRIEVTQDPYLRLAVELAGAALDAVRGDAASARECLARAMDAHGGRAPIDESADVAFAVRCLERLISAPTETRAEARSSPPGVLVIPEDGAFFQLPAGERVSLARRGPLSALLVTLARQRAEQPDVALGRETLIAAAWPGERMIKQAGINRLRVAIATLRRLGLRDAIVTRPEGYLLDPGVPLRFGDRRAD